MFKLEIISRAHRDEQGAVAAEFAIILPVIILILVLSTDYALSVLAKVQVEAAARAGAQYLVANGYDVSKITSAVTSAIPDPIAPITLQSITVECASTSGGTYVRTGSFNVNAACGTVGSFPYGTITAQIAYRPILPTFWTGLTNGTLTIGGVATTRFQ